MTKYQPLRSWILVKPDSRPDRVGHIVLPDQLLQAERVQEGTGVVVRMPNECWSKDPKARKPIREVPFKVGDRILFRGFLKELNVVEEEGVPLSLIHFEDILAVVPDDLVTGVYSLSSNRV